MEIGEFRAPARLVLILAAVSLGLPQVSAQNNGHGNGNASATTCTVHKKTFANCPPGLLKQAKREAARKNAIQRKRTKKRFAGVSASAAPASPLAAAATLPAATQALTAPATMTTGTTPDYFGIPNYANSQLPEVDPATGGIIPRTGLRKFVDRLPGLCPVSGPNNLGQCIPLATPDTTTFPGSDFYRIGLREYQKQMHSDLPSGTIATKLRGYVELDGSNAPVTGGNQYLGPLILATRNRPVRVLFKNMLTTDLNIPTDTTYMGAGSVDDGTRNIMASQKRATLHLHGGNTPWISDGTPHQWITPAGGDGQPPVLGFSKGMSFVNVPDMVGAGKPIAAESLTDGMQTFYWTNQQTGRMMFYHDHAYGITRLNVYAGEAAGYLLVDPAQESALQAATVPGTIVTNTAGNINSADLPHVIPLVIQDKTFVPDSTTNPGGQLAAQDPTWDLNQWGGWGSLWFPHVYTTNQNPADMTGSNGFGRWDWGPWFWPPVNAAGLVLPAYSCTTSALPTGGAWIAPLMCPGVPDPTRPAPSNAPSSTPEAFMDTMVVNGTVYPTLTVDPTAYRFQILSAGNDRALNLGLYVADPLAVSVTIGGSGYDVANPPAVTIAECPNATAIAVVDELTSISGINITYPAIGPGCTAAPTVSIGPPTINLSQAAQAYAIASVNTEVKMVPAVSLAARSGMPNCSQKNPMGGGGLVTALLDSNGDPLNGTGLPANCWPGYTSALGFTAGPMGENGALSWGNSDGRIGGVPDPTTAGPPFIQIGTEGGLLPTVSVIPSTPVSFDYNKRSITVLNVLNHGLFLGPAERADVIVDFSKFAGKTLILYNDSPAPVPAGDPRIDYFTNNPDSSDTGGAPTTMAGYGPNTRTVMQIVVANTTPSTTFKLSSLTAALPGLFAATQDPILVPEPAYPAGNGAGPSEVVRIADTSMSLIGSSPICGGTPCVKQMLPKAIHELFTLDYGRMNALLGVEMPFTNFTTQTTIPYAYTDPPQEIFKDGDTQIWKITHNGVDTHWIHFHLFNVQVINRVGWDGAIKLPDANEMSFKDTVRMNPLEDIVVALKPLAQTGFPFDVPNSVRPLDVTHPVGYTSTTEFTNVDQTNQPATVVNDVVNFGWEYVWHCHILGHEENDMMHAMILAVAPNKPALNSATGVAPNNVNLAWTQTSSPPYTGFTIQRSQDPTFATGVTSLTVPASPTVYTDKNVPVGTNYYRILASNLVGYTRTYAAPAAGYPHVSADSPYSDVSSAFIGPKLSLLPAGPLSLHAPLNVSSGAQTVVVQNSGTMPMTITGISVAGTDAGQFAVTNTCTKKFPVTLAAGASCSASVTFKPTSATPSPKNASLTVAVSSPATSQSVVLIGTVDVPVLNLNPTGPLAFGNIAVRATSTAQRVTISNLGTAPLTISSITVAGTNANQFARTTTCGSTLSVGGTCSVDVTFKPTSTGAKTATLNVTVGAPATSASVALTGTGI